MLKGAKLKVPKVAKGVGDQHIFCSYIRGLPGPRSESKNQGSQPSQLTVSLIKFWSIPTSC